jgi:hypothetical protein
MGMVGAQRLLQNRERAPIERLGLGILSLVAVKLRQVVEARSHIGMVGAQRLLPDRERAPIERLGLGILSLVVVKPR